MLKQTIATIRFGYGFRQGADESFSRDVLLEQLNEPDLTAAEFPNSNWEEVHNRQNNVTQALKDWRDGKEGAEERQQALYNEHDIIMRDARRKLINQAIYGTHPFRERLVSFWRDRFTVSIGASRRVYGLTPPFVQEVIRANLNGPFNKLALASTLHPAMQLYLDQYQSVGPNSMSGKKNGRGLNENLAREFLELHTLGVDGNYTQTDVRELAKLLTGYRLNNKGHRYLDSVAEPGPKNILGKVYGSSKPNNESIPDFVYDASVHPDTAKYISTKLVRHFVSDDPDEKLTNHLTQVFLKTDGDLPSVYKALLEHPNSWVPLGGKVKQPFDYVVSGLRALGVDRATLDALSIDEFEAVAVLPMLAMGQNFLSPLGPDGWPEEAEVWITPARLAARVEWALLIAERMGQNVDPASFKKDALSDFVSSDLDWSVNAASTRSEGIALTLASPEFNRR